MALELQRTVERHRGLVEIGLSRLEPDEVLYRESAIAVVVEVPRGLEGYLEAGVRGAQALEDLVRADDALGFLIIVLSWVVDIDTEDELHDPIEVIALAQSVLRHQPQEGLSVALRVEPGPENGRLSLHMRE